MERTALLFVVIALVAGCGRDTVENNLLRDPAFETIEDPRTTAWTFSQHSGEVSYSWEVRKGVLTGTHIGPETDGQVLQRIPARDLIGKTLRFSAELSGDLRAFDSIPGNPPGIRAEVVGFLPGVPTALGMNTVLNAPGSPTIEAGKFGWMVQEAIFEVPDTASVIDVSIRLGMDGMLRIRNPALEIHAAN